MSGDAAFWAKVDKAGECWLWMGYRDSLGYGQLSRGPRGSARRLYAHRYAFELAGGDPGEILDHACHTPSCVRPDHLRVATRKQNSENMLGARVDSQTGVRGVSWIRRERKWLARVVHNGRAHSKRFARIDDADAWATTKRIELFTHNDADRASA